MPSGRKKNVLKVKARGSHVRVTNLNQAGNPWFSFLIDKDDWEALQEIIKDVWISLGVVHIIKKCGTTQKLVNWLYGKKKNESVKVTFLNGNKQDCKVCRRLC